MHVTRTLGPTSPPSVWSRYGPPTLLLLSCIWVVALLAAPYVVARRSAADPSFRAAAAVYLLGRVICHQRPDRSFQMSGVQLPVCARCTGLYVAAPFGAALALTAVIGRKRGTSAVASQRRRAWAILSLAASFTIVTLVLEIAGVWQPDGWARALAAAPLGAAVAWVAGDALRTPEVN